MKWPGRNCSGLFDCRGVDVFPSHFYTEYMLTKKDLSQIKGVMHEEVEVAVETLARVVNKAFQGVEKHLELIDRQIAKIDGEIRHVNARLDIIEHDIADIRKHFVYRDEFEDVVARLSMVEKKLGIRGGKS